MSNGKQYFDQYESPNIVLVPALSSSSNGRSTANSIQTFAPYNLQPCENSAGQAMTEYAADTTQHLTTNESNLNYFNTGFNNYNLYHVNTTEENNLNVNLLPTCSQFGTIENTANNVLLTIQQPTFLPQTCQDYTWVNTNPTNNANSLVDANMYATTSNNKINIKLKEKNKNNTVTQETVDEVSLKNIHTSAGAQNNEGVLCKTNDSNDKMKEINPKIKELIDKGFDKSKVLSNESTQEKKKKMCKPTARNKTSKGTNIRASSKGKINKDVAQNIANPNNTSKEKNKVTKPIADLKYLWKRHCARLKDKIKEDIEGCVDLKTQLHTQWKAILRSEYNTFVNNFYRSAWVSKHKMKSVIANDKPNTPKSDIKNKQSNPCSANSNSAESTQVIRHKSIQDNNETNKTIQAPKKSYFRKQYENIDLRTILSRKRNQNIGYEPPKRMPKRPRERDNLIITVNQDIETDTQTPAAVEPKPKKKCNKIKLVINVVCNESDTEDESDHNDNDQCVLLNEDLSFLDDINVDDIVDSLNCDKLLDDTVSTKYMCSDNTIQNKASTKDLNTLCIDKPEEMDTAELGELASAKENNVGCRLPNNNGSMDNKTEVLTVGYNNDALILREINNVKTEFVAKIDHERNMAITETKSADQLTINKTEIDIDTQNGANIKSENANMENDCDSKSNFYQRTIETKGIDNGEITAKSEPEYSQEISTPIQIKDAITTEETNCETQLIEIKTDDEPIVISDHESNDEIITNVATTETEEIKNSTIAHEKMNLSEEYAVVVEENKKDNAQHTSDQNAESVDKSPITLDENVQVKEDIEKYSNIKGHDMIKEATPSTNIEIIKEEVKSVADIEKPSVSDEKRLSIFSTNIKKKEFAKNKQRKNMSMLDPEFLEKLKIRMFNVLDERYNLINIIHRGKFSTIFKCTNSRGENFALKLLNSVSDRRMLGSLKERMLMRLQKNIPREQLNNVYILNSFGMTGYWCFIMEYYPKNLEQALLESKKGFHINLVQALAKQLVDAVTVLTNNDIIHTDIKPKHILLNSTNDNLKLCGFEESNYIQYLNIKPSTGTASYRAPEVLLGFVADFRIDVWSTALVIFEMATGAKLFPGTFNNDILFKQMCTLGEIPSDMIQRSAYKHYHFKDNKFLRIMDSFHRTKMIPYFNKNKRLYSTLFTSYHRNWQSFATKQEVFEDKYKLNGLYQMLEQMLILDPRYRLPIHFVGVSEFIQDNFI